MKQRYVYRVTYTRHFASDKTFTHYNKEVTAVTESGVVKALDWLHREPISVQKIQKVRPIGKPFSYESNDIGDT